jgi:hypothetical protein
MSECDTFGARGFGFQARGFGFRARGFGFGFLCSLFGHGFLCQDAFVFERLQQSKEVKRAVGRVPLKVFQFHAEMSGLSIECRA